MDARRRKRDMKKLVQFLKRVTEIQKDYFADYNKEIAVRNLQFMRTVGYVGTIVYIGYFAFTELLYMEWAISPLYGFIVPLLLLFSVYAKKALAAEKINTRGALNATLALHIVLMLYVMIMSVFPHPGVPSAYYPLFLLLAPVLIILPAWQHLMINASSLVIFYVLVLNFKSAACWPHELFEATTSAVFSGIVIVFMTQYRIQSDSLKSMYYKLSRSDALTGTVNKATGEAAVREYMAEMRHNEHGAMLLVDIDDFKRYNDQYGHLAGDRLLKTVGSTLVALCRKDDIVCRFGGDEFVILLKGIQMPEAAAQKALDIIEAIAEIDNGCRRRQTCSIGISYCDKDCVSGGEEAIQRADAALYQAKRKGKNRFEVWQMDTASLEPGFSR